MKYTFCRGIVILPLCGARRVPDPKGIGRVWYKILIFLYLVYMTTSHTCNSNTCDRECYGLGQACVERCYENCLSNGF